MPRVCCRTRATHGESVHRVKLLLDENLSYRLSAEIESAFPYSQHVDAVGLHAQSDETIWEFARDNGYAIVAKDSDFCQLALLHGAPPKVIWLAVGNADTEAILRFFDIHRSQIEAFIRAPEESLLVLEWHEIGV